MSNPVERTLQINSVLYLNAQRGIAQTVAHLDRAVDLAIAGGFYSRAVLAYGDCSPKQVLDTESLAEMRSSLYALERFDYRYFGKNLGSALGHNTLLEGSEGDDVLIINPDILLAPNAIVELAKRLHENGGGIAEAKQLPVEHPKQYDASTGETSWAATACTLISGDTLKRLNGFDHQSFFLYCDDVDFSWRVRLEGEKVVYVPSACAFHDKRLGAGGEWQAGPAERFYSAQAALFLSYKYSRQDLTNRWLSEFEATGEDHYLKAVSSFRKQEIAGNLPEQIDPKGKVAMFVDGNYAIHRFKL